MARWVGTNPVIKDFLYTKSHISAFGKKEDTITGTSTNVRKAPRKFIEEKKLNSYMTGTSTEEEVNTGRNNRKNTVHYLFVSQVLQIGLSAADQIVHVAFVDGRDPAILPC